jgi:hypothetical protein
VLCRSHAVIVGDFPRFYIVFTSVKTIAGIFFENSFTTGLVVVGNWFAVFKLPIAAYRSSDLQQFVLFLAPAQNQGVLRGAKNSTFCCTVHDLLEEMVIIER